MAAAASGAERPLAAAPPAPGEGGEGADSTSLAGGGSASLVHSPLLRAEGERRTTRRRRKLELKLARARAHSVCDNFHLLFSDFSYLYFPIFRTFPESPGDFSNSRDVLQTGKIKFPDGPGGKIGKIKN